jgi:hypothetical protein
LVISNNRSTVSIAAATRSIDQQQESDRSTTTARNRSITSDRLIDSKEVDRQQGNRSMEMTAAAVRDSSSSIVRQQQQDPQSLSYRIYIDIIRDSSSSIVRQQQQDPQSLSYCIYIDIIRVLLSLIWQHNRRQEQQRLWSFHLC